MLIEARFPEWAEVLWSDKRHIGLYGGRGSGKSWQVARALLAQGIERPKKYLCGREFQKSVRESVHALLADQIDRLGMNEQYRVLDSEIRGTNGTEFIFVGLRHNARSIKSIEGVDDCWVEEAQTVSRSSMEILRPTIRKPGSRLIYTWNPELETDAVHDDLIINPISDSVAVKVNWSENPWFPQDLRSGMEDMRKRDPDRWMNVWQGHTRKIIEGAVYASELRACEEAGRICRVPYIPGSPVKCAWDLGKINYTSIWFFQKHGFDWHMLEFYQANMESLEHFVVYCQSRGYPIDQYILPHDGGQNRLGMQADKSIVGQLRAKGLSVKHLPVLRVRDGIDLVRSMFPRMWFDQVKCAEGLNALRRYRFELKEGKRTEDPLHDEHSDAADALRYVAMGVSEAKPRTPTVAPSFVRSRDGNAGWMA